MKRRAFFLGLVALPLAASPATAMPEPGIVLDCNDNLRFYAETFRTHLDRATIESINVEAERYLRETYLRRQGWSAEMIRRLYATIDRIRAMPA